MKTKPYSEIRKNSKLSQNRLDQIKTDAQKAVDEINEKEKKNQPENNS